MALDQRHWAATSSTDITGKSRNFARTTNNDFQKCTEHRSQSSTTSCKRRFHGQSLQLSTADRRPLALAAAYRCELSCTRKSREQSRWTRHRRLGDASEPRGRSAANRRKSSRSARKPELRARGVTTCKRSGESALCAVYAMRCQIDDHPQLS